MEETDVCHSIPYQCALCSRPFPTTAPPTRFCMHVSDTCLSLPLASSNGRIRWRPRPSKRTASLFLPPPSPVHSIGRAGFARTPLWLPAPQDNGPNVFSLPPVVVSFSGRLPWGSSVIQTTRISPVTVINLLGTVSEDPWGQSEHEKCLWRVPCRPVPSYRSDIGAGNGRPLSRPRCNLSK